MMSGLKMVADINAYETLEPGVILPNHCLILEGARWSSGIKAANGARVPRFASRRLPTMQRPWTSR